MSADQWRKNNRLDVDSFKGNNIQPPELQREEVRSSAYPHAEACFPTIFTSVALTNAVVERVTAHPDCRVQHIDLHTHTNCLFQNGNNKCRTERRKMQIRHRPEKVSKHSLFLKVNRMPTRFATGSSSSKPQFQDGGSHVERTVGHIL